jgi:hypothetical protein
LLENLQYNNPGASQSGPTFSGHNFSGPKILAGVGPERSSFFYLSGPNFSGPNFSGPLKQLFKKIVVSNPCIEKTQIK